MAPAGVDARLARVLVAPLKLALADLGQLYPTAVAVPCLELQRGAQA